MILPASYSKHSDTFIAISLAAIFTVVLINNRHSENSKPQWQKQPPSGRILVQFKGEFKKAQIV